MLAVHTQSTKSWATSRTAPWSKSMAGKRLTSSWSSAWVTSGFFAVSVAGARTGPGRGQRERSGAGSGSWMMVWAGSVSGLKSR